MSKPTAGPWHAIIGTPEDQPSLLYAGIISTLFYSPDSYVSVVSDEPLGTGEQSLLEECQANARLIAAAPALKEALFYAMHALDDNLQGYCECGECEECGKPVDVCTGTECSKTCQCSTCRYCITDSAYEGARAALAACTPPVAAGAASDAGGRVPSTPPQGAN